MKYVCKGFTGFNRGSSSLIMEFDLQIQKFSLGDAVHHTVSTVTTIALLPYNKAFYNICCIFNGKLSNAKILTSEFMFSEDIKVWCKLK